MLSAMFERIGDLGDLQKSIKHNEEALAATPQDHPNRAERHDNLAVGIWRRFERIGDLCDLQNAIEHGEKALAATPQDHPGRADRHNNLAVSFLARFERAGDLGDLQKAINHSEEALASTAQGHPHRAGIRNNLGNMFSTKFERTGSLGDLQKAITHGEEALAATPGDHPYGAARHSNLGATLYLRFARTGDLGDLRKAIKHCEEALSTSPQDHPGCANRHNNIGAMFSALFERMGDLDDLQKAIKHSEEGLAATPQDHPDAAARHSNLGVMFYRRFDQIGELCDLQKAIRHSEDALATTPQDRPDRADRHNNLGAMFSTRFQRMGDLCDLHKAIEHTEEALDATPQDHPYLVARKNNLGVMFSTRFGRIGDLDDLQKAIGCSEEALVATPQAHPRRPAVHSSLGSMFSMRFKRTGDICDLQKGIRHCEEALATTPHDHPRRAATHKYLGVMLGERFKSIGDLGDLQKAIKHGGEAVAATPQDHPDRATVCTALACLLYSKERFHESSSILEGAVGLMASVNLQLLRRDDQQHILSELSGLASAAASVALQAGREAYHSLKLLELGRGIIMGFTIDSKSEESDLKTDYKVEFDQFDHLRVQIDAPVDEMNCISDETLGPCRNRTIFRRWEAVNEMETVLTRIRALPGYHGFLLPPSPEALMEIAKNGPIVIFNSTTYRGDAIIVTTSAITSLELPKLNHRETSHWMGQLASFGEGGWLKRSQDCSKMKDLLIWLWDAAVGPVFKDLQRSGTIIREGAHGTNSKRIWWIGVGRLSIAPFHAAGYHSRRSTRNTLSRAISTYIPTIKALAYARRTQFIRNLRLLLVPMAETPGGISLPGVTEEVQHICDSATRNSVETTILSNPAPAEVLKQIQNHDIVHFACHGVSDVNPSNSHLVLFTPDGSSAAKLLARDIPNTVPLNAQLAYLSACSSAKNPSTPLADEVIHLASAFQLAGFSHTLANLWKTEDRASSEVASDFYNFLFQYQGNGTENEPIPIASHQAVKKFHDQ
ncbi:unnamed protein product, partial [Tuber aestivum]